MEDEFSWATTSLGGCGWVTKKWCTPLPLVFPGFWGQRTRVCRESRCKVNIHNLSGFSVRTNRGMHET